MVAQAWTDWLLIAPFAQPYPAAGLAHVQGLLGLPGRLNPDNPHPRRSATDGDNEHSSCPTSTRNSRPFPHTVLVSSRILRGSAIAGSARYHPSTDSRQLSSVYQLNPLLPNPTGQPAQPGNGITIIQVHLGRNPPVSRGTMPTYRQVPPQRSDGPANLAHLSRRRNPLVHPPAHRHKCRPFVGFTRQASNRLHQAVHPAWSPAQLAPGNNQGDNEDVHDKGQVCAGGWLLCALVTTTPAPAADSTPEVRDHADRTFRQLHTREQGLAPEQSESSATTVGTNL